MTKKRKNVVSSAKAEASATRHARAQLQPGQPYFIDVAACIRAVLFGVAAIITAMNAPNAAKALADGVFDKTEPKSERFIMQEPAQVGKRTCKINPAPSFIPNGKIST